VTDRRSEELRRLGAVFSRGSENYERLRPSYPRDAVSWLLRGTLPDARVADVGSGTGKLTAALLERGLEVVAVDPAPEMLEQLTKRLPQARTRVGSGEDTGLAERSVEAAFFGQSWHWVDPVVGAAELDRILVPGGAVGMLWNDLDVCVDWVAELAAIWHTLDGAKAVDAATRQLDLGPAFTHFESCTVDWVDIMTTEDLADLGTTRSYYLEAPADEQEMIHQRTTDLLATHFPHVRPVEVPYRTRCYRVRHVTPALL